MRKVLVSQPEDRDQREEAWRRARVATEMKAAWPRQPVEKLIQARRRFLPRVRAVLARLERRQAVIRLIREEPHIE